MKFSLSSDNDTPDYKLSAPSFALPLLSIVGLTLLQNTIAEIVGGWLFVVCLFAAPLALVMLFFKLPHRTKHALRSFLLGVLIAGVFAAWGVHTIQGGNWHG